MPPPAKPGQRYVAGLDGIRAVAVLAVVAYHLRLGWAKGGMLGVGVFFTLSGYLITDLLLAHWDRHGDLGLRDFWLRRARRLLPALFLMLAAVSVWVASSTPHSSPTFGSRFSPPRSTSATGGRSPSTAPTSRASPRRSRSTTCGRSRSRSSSTWCGPGCCCSRSGPCEAAGGLPS